MKHGTQLRPAHIKPQFKYRSKYKSKSFSLTTLKRLRPALVCLLGFFTFTHIHTYTFAQSQIDLNVESTQSGQALDSASLTFTSEPETYHFIQGSQSLQQWDYLPHASYGDGTQAQMHMSPTGSAYFYRIQSTDDPTAEPASLDFDDDGITNADELRAGAPYHFFQAETHPDPDGDSLLTSFESSIGSNPTHSYQAYEGLLTEIFNPAD